MCSGCHDDFIPLLFAQAVVGKHAALRRFAAAPAATVIAALAIPIVIAITLRRRSRGVVLAASPVRFEPPSSLRPAELQAGMEGAVTASGIAATLLDLAARGHVTITEGERRLFQADGLELTRTGQGKDSLQGWEKQLLDTTFKGEGQATIGDFDPELGRAIKVISSQLGAAGRSSGFYNPDGYRPDRPYRILALVGILGAALAFGILVASGEVRPTAALAAIVPASAWAPPMPPRPAVSIHRPARSPP